jgi:hypothetical protein
MNTWSYRSVSAVVCLLVIACFGISFGQIDRITGKPFATRSEVLARHGMVCTSVPAATQVGLDILKRGGNAVDAAIAANATLGLVEPVSNGIGGDLFAIVYSAKENKLYGINGSGRSPLGLSYEQMKAELDKLHRKTIPPRGMLPISVPGTVDAWNELHKKFGKLKLSDDLAPAVKYAEEGFPVTELIAFYWHFGPEVYKDLPGAFLQTYTLDGKGRTPAKGDIFKNPALAKTLRLIGEKGRDAFYKGEIADKIDKFMRENGGFLRKADFEKHTSDMGRSSVDELPRLRCVRATAEWTGHRHPPDLKHFGRFRSQIDGAQFSGNAARHDRSEKDCMGGSRQILCRSRVRENSAGLVCFRKNTQAERRKLIDPGHAAKAVEAGVPPANGAESQATREPLQDSAATPKRSPVDDGRHHLHVHGG